MSNCYAIEDLIPVVDPTAYVHPTAVLIGDVIIGPRCYVGPAACLRGDFATALRLHEKLMPLHAALFAETNPAPAKYALSLLGRCADTVRLPMVLIAEKTKTAVRAGRAGDSLTKALEGVRQEARWEEWPAYLLDTVDAEPA